MGARRVGVLGVTFKPDTDDIRESPSVQLIACLLRDGIDVVVHDKNIVPANLLGVNRSFLMENIPDLAQRLLQDPEELCKSVDIIVVMHSILPYRDLISRYRSLAAVLDYANLAPLEFASTPRVDDAKSADHKLKHAAALGDG
jgi:GDP-mannose 6-dehydrogenase